MTLLNHPMPSTLFAALIAIFASVGVTDAQQSPPSLQPDAASHPDANDGDTPSSAIIVLPPGTRPPADLNDNPAARARIADMLQRAQQNLGLKEQSRSPSDQQPMADPILNDVLDVIRQRGSVLDGSSLDESGHSEMQHSPDETDYPQPGRMSDIDRRYQVAESLLRSARLLQRLGASDPEQADLIRSLRQRALTLMIQSAAREKQAQPAGTPGY